MTSEQASAAPPKAAASKFIYLACPMGTVGGGMFKVADYLLQAQALNHAGSVHLRPLDTRGEGRALTSFLVLAMAICRLLAGRLSGRLAGVHVNMAERLSLFRKGLLIVACRVFGIPVVLHLHAAQMQSGYSAFSAPLKSLTRWVFSLPAGVIVLGAVARSFVIDELKVPAERVVIITNGVPGPKAAPEPESKAQAQAEMSVHRLLFLGNLMERKGVTDLLEALALPGFDRARLRVTLAGGGDVPLYQAKARHLGIDTFVTFTGWSDQAQASRLMAQAHALVLPSYNEGLPLVILEALAHSVAVVCTPVGEIPSALQDNVNACFVQAGDVAGLASTLQRVLYEPGLMDRIGRNGRLLYEQCFSMDQFFASVAQIHKLHFGVAASPRIQTQSQAVQSVEGGQPVQPVQRGLT